jgi:hypothetical protein
MPVPKYTLHSYSQGIESIQKNQKSLCLTNRCATLSSFTSLKKKNKQTSGQILKPELRAHSRRPNRFLPHLNLTSSQCNPRNTGR